MHSFGAVPCLNMNIEIDMTGRVTEGRKINSQIHEWKSWYINNWTL